MINLFQFQAISSLAYLSLFLLLLLCPYQGEEFRTYHRVRRIFMSMLLLTSMQFVIQMIFGFRTHDVLLGAVVNMCFIFTISQLCNMTLLTMMKPNDSTRRDWMLTSLASVLNVAILMFGWFFDDGSLARSMYHLSILYYALFDIALLYVQFRHYRRIHQHLQEYYSKPVEEHTTWVKVYLAVRLLICVSLPLVLLDNLWAVIFSMGSFLSFTYFVAKFMYYGYYVRIVERAEVSLDGTQEGPSDESVSSNGPQYVDRQLEQVIDQWVGQLGYCDSNITLDSLAQRLGVRRRELSQYVNVCRQTTFRDWLNTLRIEQAKRVIVERPQLSFEQIADKVGFSSRSYFDVVFKEKVGQTPAAWRHSILGKPL